MEPAGFWYPIDELITFSGYVSQQIAGRKVKIQNRAVNHGAKQGAQGARIQNDRYLFGATHRKNHTNDSVNAVL